MLSDKLKMRISLILGILSWMAFTYLDLYLLFYQKNNLPVGLTNYVPRILQTIFILSLFFFYRYRITKAENFNFLDLLWKVFVTGLITTIVSLAIRSFFMVFGNSAIANNLLLINLFYHINIGLITAFLVSTFIIWKKLILYQKSKLLMQFWNLFEYSLLGGLVFDIIGYQQLDPVYNAVLVFLVLQGLVLSFNLKWVAYLNFKQKWKSILFIVLVGIYLWHFFTNLTAFSKNYTLVLDLLNEVFIIAIFTFIFIYAVVSILVIIFNLPTSSVFERKLKEAMDFQRLSQSIPAGQNEEQVYEILLDSSMSAVFADGAWLEIEGEDGEHSFVTRNVEEHEVNDIKISVKNASVKKILSTEFDRSPGSQKITAALKHPTFKSIMVLPIMVKSTQVGSLVLLKEVSDGFNKEMINIISTFVNQASISVENFRLINEAIENERYQEELKIAKRVQQALLPSDLEHNGKFDICAYSVAADEVGGDYYDLLKLEEEKYALIIGDVSGKGTSAAFHMSQMKGIFHSLSQLNLNPKDFLVHANSALSRCLEKTSFITTSFYLIDTSKNQIQFSRAGHCPSLFYCKQDGTTEYFQNKGLGLGILRNSDFHKYVQVNELNYSEGDVLVLYTDGITEATNSNGEEFGYDRLKRSLEKSSHQAPTQIKEGIIKDLYDFLGTTDLNDDYTVVILKF